MTSNMDDLVILVTIAAEPTPKVKAGKITLLIPENPPEGSNPNFTENNKTNISPNQNTGIETPNKASTILILSTAEYCLVAEIIPIGIPITTAMITPNTANTKVFGNLEKISANTSLPVV